MNAMFYPRNDISYREMVRNFHVRQEHTARPLICMEYEKAVDRGKYKGPYGLLQINNTYKDIPAWMDMICGYYGCSVSRHPQEPDGEAAAAGCNIFLGKSTGEQNDIAMFFTGLAMSISGMILGTYWGGCVSYWDASHWHLESDTNIITAFENGLTMATSWGFDTRWGSPLYTAFHDSAVRYLEGRSMKYRTYNDGNEQ